MLITSLSRSSIKSKPYLVDIRATRLAGICHEALIAADQNISSPRSSNPQSRHMILLFVFHWHETGKACAEPALWLLGLIHIPSPDYNSRGFNTPSQLGVFRGKSKARLRNDTRMAVECRREPVGIRVNIVITSVPRELPEFADSVANNPLRTKPKAWIGLTTAQGMLASR